MTPSLSSSKKTAGWAAALLLALATLLAYWETSPGARGLPLRILTSRPKGVMGTTCLLLIRVPPEEVKKGKRALSRAEAALRKVEAAMSSHLADSEISRLNAAPPARKVPLSPWTLQVLREARDLWKATGGAFDVTCRPLLLLWKKAARAGRLPTPREIRTARQASRWDLLELGARWARKKGAGLQVDLGGIAKGFGIDKALEAMKKTGVPAGLVDVGGDLRAFGPGTGPGGTWKVDVLDPFTRSPAGSLALREGAVCTSGGYFRYVEIQGKRYSHILDPRTGRPARAASSVTLLGKEAARTDAWATALAVLGPQGLPLLQRQKGLEALVVTGTREKPRFLLTPGMKALYRPGP
ncbi:MAG TPA: FAD:protein FMN transferase [Planctomycetes bacterium]|nr:FAD:protein FMN transferase [Planctomycetota bacterium]